MAIHIEIGKRGKRFIDTEQGANLSLSNLIARLSFNQEISTSIFLALVIILKSVNDT